MLRQRWIKIIGQVALFIGVFLIQDVCGKSVFDGYDDLPIDLKRAKSYIEEKLSQAVVETNPFPHIIVKDILPPDLYQQMLRYWPDPEAFDISNNHYRRRLPVTGGCAEARKGKLSNEQIIFWRTFGEIVAKYMKFKITDLLLPYLHYRFPDADAARLTYIRNHLKFFDGRRDGLVIDFSNYALGPHVDNVYFLAAMLLYCPEDESHLTSGTAFYESSHLSVDNHTILPHWRKEEFHLHKIAPYAPNTLVVIMQTPSAWHGVELLNDPSYIRKAYLCDIYLAPECVEELYPELFDVRGNSLYSTEFLYKWDAHFLNPEGAEYKK